MSASMLPLSPTVVQEIDQVLSVYSDIIVEQYTTISSFIILAWEYAITFDDECQYFWNAPFSLTGFLYFFNRYVNLICRLINTIFWLLPHKSYNVGFYFVKYVITGTSTMALFAAELVLILRIWAVYGKSKKVLIVTTTLWLVASAASSAVLVVQSEHAYGTNEPIPGLFFCVVTAPINTLYAYWIPNVVFEGFAFILVGYKAFQHTRETSGAKAITRTSLMNIIFRDSLEYVTVMFCAALANAMLYRFGRPGLYSMAQGPTVSMFSVLVTRMLTNLRKAGKHAGSETLTASGEMTSLRFQGRHDAASSGLGQDHLEDMVTTGIAVEEVELRDMSASSA